MELVRQSARWLAGMAEWALILVGASLYAAGLAPAVIRLGRRGVRVLMYHACEDREDDFVRGLAINTPPDRMARQLDFLRAHYRVIPVEQLGRGPIPERSAAITFDDGFRSVHDRALPLLEARGLPATCYLVTDRLDDDAPIWINELNWFLRQHGAAARALVGRRLGIGRRWSTSAFLAAVLDRYDPAAIAEILAELRATWGPPPAVGRPHLDAAMVAEMARRGFHFGNHTATHAVLSRLDPDACRDEIARARSALAGLPGAIDSLAYPFGRCSDEVARIARELGHETLMDVMGTNDPIDLDHIGRVNVTSDSPAVLFARLEVVDPLKSALRRLLRRARGARA